MERDFQRNPEETAQEKKQENSGCYECFHCGERAVIWGGDFSFEDYGMEGEGIVHNLHCSNCGADIEYYIPIDSDGT